MEIELLENKLEYINLKNYEKYGKIVVSFKYSGKLTLTKSKLADIIKGTKDIGEAKEKLYKFFIVNNLFVFELRQKSCLFIFKKDIKPYSVPNQDFNLLLNLILNLIYIK